MWYTPPSQKTIFKFGTERPARWNNSNAYFILLSRSKIFYAKKAVRQAAAKDCKQTLSRVTAAVSRGKGNNES